jgi:hypothetical protein
VVFSSVWNLCAITETFVQLCLSFCDIYVTCLEIFYSMNDFLFKFIEVFVSECVLVIRMSKTCSGYLLFCYAT